MLTFIDLFCGAGGFTEGLKQAGYHHGLGIDFDKYAAKTYRENHGDMLEKDLKDVTVEDIVSRVDKVDIIAASPPCQSFSVAGRRQSGDPRDQLYREVIRLADALKPRWVLMENVVGMLTKRQGTTTTTTTSSTTSTTSTTTSTNTSTTSTTTSKTTTKRIIDFILEDLNAIGYAADYRVLSADEFGVPQKRKRVVIVASRDPSDIVFPCPFAERKTIQSVLLPREQVPKEYFWSQKSVEYFKKKPQYACYVDPNKPSPTIRACYFQNRGQEAVVKYDDDDIRMLTERECASLQTFPEDYVFIGSKSRVYRQIGNAIPVALARCVGLALKGLNDN